MLAALLQYFYLQKFCVLEVRIAPLNRCALNIRVMAMFIFIFRLLSAWFKDALFPDFVSNPFPYVSLQPRWFEAVACCSGALCADGNRRLLNEAFFFPLTLLIGIPLTDI